MAYNIIATGPGLCGGKTNQFNDIIVNKETEKSGKLSTEIEGPSRVTIKYIDNHDGSVKISYKPTIPGDYCIFLKFNSFHLPGSPFRVKIVGSSPVSLTRYGDGHIRSVASLRHAVLCTSADFMWIKKPGVNLTLNGSHPDCDNFGGRTCVEAARY